MPQVASTSCTVDIIAPTGARVVFDATEAETDLLGVETEKDLRNACGSFTLHFAPRMDEMGRTWDQIIPMRSLVFIDMVREGDGPEGPGRPTVMVGLTDDHRHTEDFRQTAPRRAVTIRGRELSCVLLDAMLFYHPRLADDPATGTLTTRTKSEGERVLALSWNPKLSRPGETPQVILQRILDYFLLVGGSVVEPPATPGLQQPIMNLDLPGVLLSDLLDKNVGQWNTFEPVIVPVVHHPMMAGSLWNYLHLVIDRAFQEFFTRIEDGICKIHFRGKPFRHALVDAGTRFKSSEEEPTLQTLALNPDWMLAQDMSRQSQQVYNFFLASPLGITQYYDDPNFLYKVLPQIITDPTHPSFVGRYGLRTMLVKSPYLTPLPPQATTATPPAAVPLDPPPAAAPTYAGMAARIAAEEGLPPALIPWFVANIHQESNFNPNAVSPTGATGIAQFTSATAADMGLANRLDPVASLHASARYWNFLRTFSYIRDNPVLIAAAYNAGPGAVQAAGGVPPGEATRHVRKVTQYQKLYVSPTPSAVRSPSTAPAQGDLGALVETAERWSALLGAWYDMGGELFAGTLEVRGHPGWNVGHRLVSEDARGTWEAYIEGVAHQYDCRTGRYVTTLRITRGWYLDGGITEQMRREGQTTVTEVSGGPPAVAPTEGEESLTHEVLVGFPEFPNIPPR